MLPSDDTPGTPAGRQHNDRRGVNPSQTKPQTTANGGTLWLGYTEEESPCGNRKRGTVMKF